MPSAGSRRDRAALLRAARAEIRRRLQDPDLDLRVVAAAVGASPRQVQRVFAESGESFRAYRLRLRMTEAERLLRRGLPVRVVARRVGYREASGFRQALWRFSGQRPSDLRPPPLDYDELWREQERRARGR